MEEEIITKLKSALAEPIQKECQVVYILVEIRKLLERLKDKNNFSVLNFYSNWALHPEIDKTSSIRPILEKIEEAILRKTYDVNAIMAIVDFEEFCKEIGTFLGKFAINNPFLKIDYWRKFRRLLVGVLIDCPLKPNYGEIKEFRFIKAINKDDVDYRIEFKSHFPISGSWTFLNY